MKHALEIALAEDWHPSPQHIYKISTTDFNRVQLWACSFKTAVKKGIFWFWHTAFSRLREQTRERQIIPHIHITAHTRLQPHNLTLPGHAVDNLWRDCARWILGLFTIWPTGSCSFFPAKASWENAVWYPGVSSISMKCSSSGRVSSSGNSKRPMRAWRRGVLWRKPFI